DQFAAAGLPGIGAVKPFGNGLLRINRFQSIFIAIKPDRFRLDYRAARLDTISLNKSGLDSSEFYRTAKCSDVLTNYLVNGRLCFRLRGTLRLGFRLEI